MTPIEDARACLAYAKRHLHNEVVMREQIIAAEKLLADALQSSRPPIWDDTNRRFIER